METQTTPTHPIGSHLQSHASGRSLRSIFEARLKYSTAGTPTSLNLSSAAVGFAFSAEGISSSLALQGRRPCWIFFFFNPPLNLSPRFYPSPSWIFEIPETFSFLLFFFASYQIKENGRHRDQEWSSCGWKGRHRPC